MKLSTKSASTTHRTLVYGGPKTGKTEIVGKLAEKYKIIFLDCDQGWNTLLKLPMEYQDPQNTSGEIVL